METLFFIILSILLILVLFQINFLIKKNTTNLHLLNEYSKNVENKIEIQQQNIKLVEQNENFKRRHAEYRQFFLITLNSLQEDTEFLRSSFFQRFGNLPDYQEVNSQLHNFSIRVAAILEAIEEYEQENKKEK